MDPRDPSAPIVALPNRGAPRSYPAGSHLPERYTSEDLQYWDDRIRAEALKIGIDVPDIVFHLVQSEEMYDVAARGLPGRYSHWWFGQQYASQKNDYDTGRGRIYELVINTLPPHAYLLDGNSIVSQLMVMSHVVGHVFFFLHNRYFSTTDRKILPRVAHAAERIDGYMGRYGRDLVEDWIEHAEALAWQLPYEQLGRRRTGEEDETIDPFDDLFPEEVATRRAGLAASRAARAGRFPAHPDRDVLGFVLNNARHLADWQRDVISIIRSETSYFVPQTRTQVMNEGIACVRGDMRIATAQGLVRADDVVENRFPIVWDGEEFRDVQAWRTPGTKSGKVIRTRRGFTLAASDDHRVKLADGTWKYIDTIRPGDDLELPHGPDTWAANPIRISWEPSYRMTIADVAARAGVSIGTVQRIAHAPDYLGTPARAQNRERVLPLLAERERRRSGLGRGRTVPITVPAMLDERLAAFLGYLVTDGYIATGARTIGMVSADYEQVERFQQLGEQLFGIRGQIITEPTKWRAHFSSRMLERFLVEYFGITTGKSARIKRVPEQIFRSPEPVVRSFLRAAYDADGCASANSGVIFTTFSDQMASDVGTLLWNYDILFRRHRNGEGWNIQMTNGAAQRFASKIGFGLERKQQRLHRYINDRQWFCKERRDNIVTEIHDESFLTYDLHVNQTHRYATAGFTNHNCLIHLHIMNELNLPTEAFLEFQALTSGVVAPRLGHPNPYSLGLIMWQEIARMCSAPTDDERERWPWAGNVMNEWEKIFEIVEGYDDAAFIAEFLTPTVCERAKLFAWDAERHSQQRVIVVSSHEVEVIKERLVAQHTNRGLPVIEIVDADGLGRGELWLVHRADELGLDDEYAKHTLEHLSVLWGKRVVIETVGTKGTPRWFSASPGEVGILHTKRPE